MQPAYDAKSTKDTKTLLKTGACVLTYARMEQDYCLLNLNHGFAWTLNANNIHLWEKQPQVDGISPKIGTFTG